MQKGCFPILNCQKPQCEANTHPHSTCHLPIEYLSEEGGDSSGNTSNSTSSSEAASPRMDGGIDTDGGKDCGAVRAPKARKKISSLSSMNGKDLSSYHPASAQSVAAHMNQKMHAHCHTKPRTHPPPLIQMHSMTLKPPGEAKRHSKGFHRMARTFHRGWDHGKKRKHKRRFLELARAHTEKQLKNTGKSPPQPRQKMGTPIYLSNLGHCALMESRSLVHKSMPTPGNGRRTPLLVKSPPSYKSHPRTRARNTLRFPLEGASFEQLHHLAFYHLCSVHAGGVACALTASAAC